MNTVLRRQILSLPRSYTRLYSTNNKSEESPAPPNQRFTFRQFPPSPSAEPRTPPWWRDEASRRSSIYPPWTTRPQTRSWQRPEDLSQRSPHPPSTQPQTRHEAHEGTTALNVPFNPPGGGPGANIPGGGGGGGTFTKNPILDTILATALGLGAGNSICTTHLSLPAQVP